MLTSKEYLQRAEECSQLANASGDVYVKKALTELACEFKATAKGPGTAQRTLTRNRSWAGRKMRRHDDNCRADVKWMNRYALRPHHELSDAHRYPA
jgi:hypothetical protein